MACISIIDTTQISDAGIVKANVSLRELGQCHADNRMSITASRRGNS